MGIERREREGWEGGREAGGVRGGERLGGERGRETGGRKGERDWGVEGGGKCLSTLQCFYVCVGLRVCVCVPV